MAYTDDFNRADGGLGGDWTANAGSFQIISNQVKINTYESGGLNESMSHYSSGSFADDQYAIITNVGFKDVIKQGVAVRCSGSGVRQAYVLAGSDSTQQVALYRLDTGTSYVTLHTFYSIALADGCKLKLTVEGSATVTLHSYYDIGAGWVELGTGDVDESANRITTGRPGMFQVANSGGEAIFDDWEGGNLAAGGVGGKILSDGIIGFPILGGSVIG